MCTRAHECICLQFIGKATVWHQLLVIHSLSEENKNIKNSASDSLLSPDFQTSSFLFVDGHQVSVTSLKPLSSLLLCAELDVPTVMNREFPGSINCVPTNELCYTLSDSNGLWNLGSCIMTLYKVHWFFFFHSFFLFHFYPSEELFQGLLSFAAKNCGYCCLQVPLLLTYPHCMLPFPYLYIANEDDCVFPSNRYYYYLSASQSSFINYLISSTKNN